jgi:hypothetical protein
MSIITASGDAYHIFTLVVLYFSKAFPTVFLLASLHLTCTTIFLATVMLSLLLQPKLFLT